MGALAIQELFTADPVLSYSSLPAAGILLYTACRTDPHIPVSYTHLYVANRQCFDDELKVWLKNKNLALEQMLKQNEINGVQRRQLHSCGKIMYTKDSVWKYEKEYRIVTRNHEDIKKGMFDSYKDEKGSLHKTQEFDLSLSKVYLGMNCTEENLSLIHI